MNILGLISQLISIKTLRLTQTERKSEKTEKRAEKMETNPARHSEQGPRPKKGRTEDKKDRDNRKIGPSKKLELYTLKCPT